MLAVYNFFRGRLLLIRICLFTAMLLLVAVGIATLYGIGHPAESSGVKISEDMSGFWKKQVIFAVVGLVGFIAVNLPNYREFGAGSYWIYIVLLILLGVLLVSRYFIKLPFAPELNGSNRWISFSVGGHSLPAIQPSEFCKLGYIIALAWYLRYRSNYRRFRSLIGPFVLTLLPMVMILAEPDLGTTILMMPVFFTMLFVAGAKAKHLIMVMLLAVLVSPVMWFKMNSYQRKRISSVLLQSKWLREKAENTPKLGQLLVGDKFTTKKWMNDWGYHLRRSKFAIASGGLTGYGYRKGPFIKYDFLPYRYNDFVFSSFAHQWGFLGCLALLSLYVVIVLCALAIIENNTDPFGKLMCVGIICMFVVEVLVNISMTVGLMPITGLTLPFISKGGSSLVVSMMAIGLLNNVGRCRPFTVAPKM